MSTPEPTITPEDETTFWGEHRLVLLLIITIVSAIVLTVVSLGLYSASGAAQLDLSRPGYRSVSDQIDRETKIDEYQASGPIDKAAIEEFMELYDEQADKAKSVDAFNGDPLNPEVLEFGTTTD